MIEVLVTGGCGYIGTELVLKLLNTKRYKITVVDIQWFGNKLKKNKNLEIKKIDIKDIFLLKKKFHTIIHLANIANDPTVDLNPVLSWEVNVLGSRTICEYAKKYKIKKVIYFSSGSVYGIKNEKNVTENLSLNPISVYNKTKMIAERIFLSYKSYFRVICIRPATVCGNSKRLRLDLTLNKLTYDAVKKNKIIVDGGSQIRPNVHIKDIINVVFFFLKKKQVKFEIYNVGFENFSILNIAKKISHLTGAKIIVNKKIDPRSYRQDSSRLIKEGFVPKYNIDMAIKNLVKEFSESDLDYNENNFNILKMRRLGL